MESRILNAILAILSITSFVWSYFSQENRIIGIIISFLLIILILISEKNIKIKELEIEQKKLEEKLKIHEQLINVKSDIKELQKRVFKK